MSLMNWEKQTLEIAYKAHLSTNSMDMNLSKLLGIVKDRKSDMLQSMELKGVRHILATE